MNYVLYETILKPRTIISSLRFFKSRSILCSHSLNVLVFNKYKTEKFNKNLWRKKYHVYNPRRLYSKTDYGKDGYEIHETVKKSQLLQGVIQKKKEQLLEKRDGIVKDIRETKTRVKEKMEEVLIERENVLTIPNLLCVGRAVLAPYLGYIIIQGDYSFALGLLAAAGVSDLLDGWIARTWSGQASKMGSFLDPMADKLLVGSLFISLTWCHLLPIWLTCMVLTRDVVLVGAGFVIRYQSLPPPKTWSRYFDVTHATAQLAPTFISKVNTAVQLVLVASALGAPVWDYVDHPALQGLCLFTGATTVAAAVSYVLSRNTYRFLRKTKQNKQQNDRQAESKQS